jgi:N-acetylneuraminic acid mutarotase
MPSTEETLATMRREMWPLLETAMEGVLTEARGVLDAAEQQRAQESAEVAEDRAKGLAEVAEERNKGLAEVDARWAELHREIAAMHTHKEAQEGRVELNIGGYRFETSVQTLRRLPHTFFDAYFSGRYAQDICADGSIFVDRDGEHFGHVLEYLRDDCLSVAEPGAQPDMSLLHALKQEFDFYCIELYVTQFAEAAQPETAFVMGGWGSSDSTIRSMEQYDPLAGQWSAAAPMGIAREHFGACVIAGEIYVCGGVNDEDGFLSSVERYSPVSDTWSAVAPLPEARTEHAAVAVGSAMYVLGGTMVNGLIASTLKYDSVLGTWTEVAPFPDAMSACAACAVGSDIYVFEENVNVLKYDTMENTWSTLAPMPSERTNHSVSVLDGLVYVVGVEEVGQGSFRYDPASDAWSTLSSGWTRTDFGSSFVLGDNLYAVGGGENHVSESVERYNVAMDTWTKLGNLLEGRLGFCSVTIGSVGSAEEEDLFDRLIATAKSRTNL